MSKRYIDVAGVRIGGGAPVSIQSMTTADTADTQSVLAQIRELEEAGCELVRVAAYDLNSAKNIRNIVDGTSLPIIADVHFDAGIAIAAIEAGAHKVRINPGNIGSRDKIESVVRAAKMAGVPIRVGANSGSLAKDYAGLKLSDALVESALSNVRILEKLGFYDIAISLKASDVSATIQAYRKMSGIVDYPLHLGVTEAGAYAASVVKSSIGIGSLLVDGIGDTIRVSVTGDPVREIGVARDILRYSGVRNFGPEIISCPTCARTKIALEKMVERVEKLTANMTAPLKIAVMGCAVNGPGEAKSADAGIAGGKGEGLIFIRGEIYKKLPEEKLLSEFADVLEKLAKEMEA